jgi:hypothetical protein
MMFEALSTSWASAAWRLSKHVEGISHPLFNKLFVLYLF